MDRRPGGPLVRAASSDKWRRIWGAGSFSVLAGHPMRPFIAGRPKSGRSLGSSPWRLLVHDTRGYDGLLPWVRSPLRGIARHPRSRQQRVALRLPALIALSDNILPRRCALSTRDGYDVARLPFAHPSTPEGQTCMTGGCLARLSCPLSQWRPYGARPRTIRPPYESVSPIMTLTLR